MPEVLMVAGKPETIFSARDFEYLIEKHMGYDAAKYFREIISELENAADETAQKIQTDLNSYEGSLESNTSAFNEIQDHCVEMVKEFHSPEMSERKRFYLRSWFEHISKIKDIINNQI